jgi:lysophospholipase L1-like esterase
MKRKIFYLLFFISGLLAQQINAQNKPAFWDDIQRFKQKDSLNTPTKNGIVFVGSSSFTNWTTLEKVYQNYGAINRGFGGSTLAQANHYVADLVFPYEPRQVVIYSGENDIAIDQTSALETLSRFATFFTSIRNKYPKTAILYVSMKQSPSRMQHAETVLHANNLIKDFLSAYSNTKFVDVNRKMLRNGQPRPELFLKDMLHMNQAGYDIWIKEITPHLLK